MKEEYIQMQISLSTAEDARNYFCGDTQPARTTYGGFELPPGLYRVIDGMLFRLAPGLPPGIPAGSRG
jgi:hypothetical protein